MKRMKETTERGGSANGGIESKVIGRVHMTSNQTRQNGEAGVGLGIELWAILKFMGRLFIYPRGKGGKGVFFLLDFPFAFQG